MNEKTVPMINRGVILRLEAGSLQPGQLLDANNIDSTKEGSVCPTPGSKQYVGNEPGVWLNPHTLAKMKIGSVDALDPRYVGEESNIWRVTGPYSNDVLVSFNLGLTAARWEAQPYNSGSSGNPYMFFAHPSKPLKDDSTFSPLHRWGIPPPVVTATVVSSGSGGQNGSYSYAYTFRNPQTGQEGNPCALMVTPITLTSQGATITFYGADTNVLTGNPEIIGLGSISIYRAGGSFADEIYRFVGYATNPGYTAGVPQTGMFTETHADLDLINASEMEFDNDQPVTSSLPVPFVGAIQAIAIVGSGPFYQIALNGYPNYAAGLGLSSFFTIGSQVTIGTQDNQEVGIVFLVDTTTGVGPHWIQVAVQNSHSTGEQVSCDANANKPCDLICLYQDAILLAGDPNNPHVVYRSKSGAPDAFPVIDLEDGNAHQLNVGSPSNPIMGILEYDGEVVCLNQKSIFVFIVLNGTMSPPQETPSDRGMVAKHCWCKVKNEVWFLSYDGLYSWNGGDAKLRTEAIRDIFNNYTTTIADQTYYQIDYTQLAAFHMECFEQEVWLDYIDVKGNYIAWRYQILYDRWLPRTLDAAVPNGAVFGALMTEKDTGRLIAGVQVNNPNVVITATSNGSPDVITAPGNVLVNGQTVEITGCMGDTAPNGGNQIVTNVGVAGPGTFELVGVNGNGTYTGGGIVASGTGYLNQMNIGTSESWNTLQNDGVQIQWGFQTGFVYPEEKTHDVQMTELVIELENDTMGPGDEISFSMTYDFNPSVDPVDQFGVTNLQAGGRRFLYFPLQRSNIDSTAIGKNAKAVSLTVFGKTVNHVEIYSWTIRFNPRQVPTKNSILSWQNLGSPNPKYLYCLDLEYDPKGQPVDVYLDIIAGIEGAQVPAVQTFNLFPAVYTQLLAPAGPSDTTITLISGLNISIGTVLQIDNEKVYVISNPGIAPTVYRGYLGTTAAAHASGAIVSSLGRVRQTLPIVDNVIATSVRLRNVVPGQAWEVFDWKFDPIEQYPPYIVFFSELTDNGSPYLKFVNQLALDVNTNGVTVIVNLELDGAVVFSFPVQTNRFTRYTNITCPSQLAGVNMRVLPQQPLPANAMFQLWGVTYVTQMADEGPVNHSYDFDDLGWPYDKQLTSVVFDYSGDAGDVVMQCETIAGINGINAGPVLTFPLSGNTRAKQQFGINGVIAKMVRISPASNPALAFRSWKYKFEKNDYPPDFVLTSPKNTFGYPCEKVARNLELDIDTGSVPATVQLFGDGNLLQTVTVTTSVNDRSRIIALNPNLIAREFYIQLQPGPGGKTQLFNWTLSFVKEPCAVSFYDSLETRMSYIGFKYIKEYWIAYASTSTVTLSIYVDGDKLFWQVLLPVHPNRDEERGYLPAIDVTNTILNKSKTYRFTLQATSGTFRLYADSAMEWSPFGAGQRLQRFSLTENQQLPVA